MIYIGTIICVIAITITLINFAFILHKKEPSYDKISFKEAMDLTGNPVIVFYNRDKKLHFLLDTGANVSAINKADLEGCEYISTNSSMRNMGIEGNYQALPIISMDLKYKDNTFNENLLLGDFSAAFAEVKKSTGVTVHGILGTSFFTKYKYVLDFDELVAYSKMKL